MTTLLNKATSKLSVSTKADKDEDKAFIRSIDYDELEKRFQVRKYVPSFIHNYDYLTPQIRSMINDKPIYAEANKHVKKPRGTKKNVAEFDLVTGELITKPAKPAGSRKDLICDQIQERKELRKEHREKRIELKKQYKNERRSEKEETRKLLREHRNQRRNTSGDTGSVHNSVTQKEFPKAESSFLFVNPFESGQTTLVESRRHPEHTHDRKNSVLTLHRASHRRPSLSSTLKGLVLHKKHEDKHERLSLSRTFSYDQTKSIMTTKRDADKDLLKYKNSSGRRMSEVTRMYLFTNLVSFDFFWKIGSGIIQDGLNAVLIISVMVE